MQNNNKENYTLLRITESSKFNKTFIRKKDAGARYTARAQMTVRLLSRESSGNRVTRLLGF